MLFWIYFVVTVVISLVMYAILVIAAVNWKQSKIKNVVDDLLVEYKLRLSCKDDRISYLSDLVHKYEEQAGGIGNDRIYAHLKARNIALSKKLRNMRKRFSQFAASIGHDVFLEEINRDE